MDREGRERDNADGGGNGGELVDELLPVLFFVFEKGKKRVGVMCERWRKKGRQRQARVDDRSFFFSFALALLESLPRISSTLSSLSLSLPDSNLSERIK